MTIHENCPSRAYQEVTCDVCGKTYTCTPASDYFCRFPEGDHTCESCLVDGIGVTEMTVMTEAELAKLAGGE